MNNKIYSTTDAISLHAGIFENDYRFEFLAADVDK